jgi:hypothetical protein
MRYTHTENESTIRVMTVQAVEAGFLPAVQRLDYTKGNGSYAVPTRIRVQELVRDEKSGELVWRYVSQPSWVPEFSYKDGPTTVGRTLEVMTNMFYDNIRRKRVVEEIDRK